ADERGELLERSTHAGGGRRVRPAALRGEGRSREPAARPVEERVDPADKLVAHQDRHHVVAESALRLRHVDLDREVEPPKPASPCAITDQVVEGGEEHGARFWSPTRRDLVQEREVL